MQPGTTRYQTGFSLIEIVVALALVAALAVTDLTASPPCTVNLAYITSAAAESD